MIGIFLVDILGNIEPKQSFQGKEMITIKSADRGGQSMNKKIVEALLTFVRWREVCAVKPD